jgi:DNA-directed RNA polymerase specialized sigma24 family protein
VQKLEPKRDWVITPSAFRRLLDWLDAGTDSRGQNYLGMLNRLVAYFDRKNCATPQELADETLNRVARRLEEEGNIEGDSPAQYCYIVARFVFMETLRAGQKEVAANDLLRRESIHSNSVEPGQNLEKEEREKLLECLERCTDKLETRSREIILRYYIGEERTKIENRRALAAELGITMNAISIRACRIRDKLEACVSECAGKVK